MVDCALPGVPRIALVFDTPASGCGTQYKIPFVETHPTNYVECISAPKYYKDLSELQYFKD